MKTVTALFPAALFSVLLLGSSCAEDVDERRGDIDIECGSVRALRDFAGARNKSCWAPSPRGDASTELSLECGDVQRDAYALLRDSQRCDSDSDCVVESVAARCLNAFLCPVAIGRGADLVSIRRQALSRSLEHQRCSLTKAAACPIASCATSAESAASCNPSTKLCEPKAALDASVPSAEAGADAGSPTFPGMDASLDAASPAAVDAARPDV
jgi:hypothetical protein